MATAKSETSLQFDSLNAVGNLEFLEGRSPDELLGQIKSIRREIKIVAMYFYGNKHIAWIQGNFKKKIKE